MSTHTIEPPVGGQRPFAELRVAPIAKTMARPTGSLSRKIWQKITVLEMARTGHD